MSFNLSNCIGLKVKVVTTIDTSFQGTIYSYDPSSSLLILSLDEFSKTQLPDKFKLAHQQSVRSSAKNFKVLKCTFIKSIQVLNKKQSLKAINKNSSENTESLSTSSSPSLGPASSGDIVIPLSPASLQRNYGKSALDYTNYSNLNKILTGQLNKNNYKGVEIFKKLYKILPQGEVKFSKNDDITVFDTITIKYPYDKIENENCKDEDQLAYIKKIVSGVEVKGG
ncbi:hypothetical protein PACTADRAFT_47641 [Pachysolen tannophilus NRRL Y-2460]|uniref:LSM12 anticodon-binding domain-containing protein n=1 Tax=Pachysolen tannophilus NRRL Y-2460 TaxID=669874 RepID=A0A1E4U1B3_PACTA|nr:hypothetical protein PACTADRAFT_47641 [Pachysolen tannophilus NRRL Y-2460]